MVSSKHQRLRICYGIFRTPPASEMLCFFLSEHHHLNITSLRDAVVSSEHHQTQRLCRGRHGLFQTPPGSETMQMTSWSFPNTTRLRDYVEDVMVSFEHHQAQGLCTMQYNATLLPSVNTIARGFFCGAKYIHHTFTPIIKHHSITTTANKHPSKTSFSRGRHGLFQTPPASETVVEIRGRWKYCCPRGSGIIFQSYTLMRYQHR